MGDFEDHCWRDVVPAEILELYAPYRRDVFVGPNPALVVIDLYELAYEGGPHSVSEVSKTYPSSCGIHAHAAIPPTKRLFEAARAAGIPIFYSTSETREDANLTRVTATKRNKARRDASAYEIRADFAPQPGDVIIRKQRASAFYGTPLLAHLTRLGVQSVIVIGESTSGCVRASAVDAFSSGYHVSLVEECCFDRFELSHKINLFDMHHKYADVLKIDQVVAELGALAARSAA